MKAFLEKDTHAPEKKKRYINQRQRKT